MAAVLQPVEAFGASIGRLLEGCFVQVALARGLGLQPSTERLTVRVRRGAGHGSGEFIEGLLWALVVSTETLKEDGEGRVEVMFELN